MEPSEEDVWTKPAASFRIKKTGGSRGRASFSQVVAGKRRNPFLQGDSETEVASHKKPRLADSLGRRMEAGLGQQLEGAGDSHDSGLELSSPSSSPDSETPRSPPLDWTLKSRIKFSSASGFGWTQHLSTVEEASGVTGGVRCLSLSRGAHCLDTSLRAQFHAACMYWQHPSLPVPLFPRYSQSSLRSPGPGPSLSLSPDMQKALHSDWMSALQSAYQLVKARQCPYFYLLGPNFTCLFRAAGISGTQEITALVTPSTCGLRAALKREDVEFSLPLYTPRQEEESSGGVPETDSTTEFLESLGIEADSLPGLTGAAPKHRLAAGQGSAGNIDLRPESLLLIEGIECQSLLNYLLNAKLSVGQGVAALPPTLLAPVAFQGAALRALKLRQSSVAGRGAALGTSQHSVEVTGPLLPGAVQAMARLAAAHNRHHSVTLQTAEETVGFCLVGQQGSQEGAPGAPSAFASASLGDCGLSGELLRTFTAPAARGEGVVRDLVWRAGEGFTVNSVTSNSAE